VCKSQRQSDGCLQLALGSGTLAWRFWSKFGLWMLTRLLFLIALPVVESQFGGSGQLFADPRKGQSRDATSKPTCRSQTSQVWRFKRLGRPPLEPQDEHFDTLRWNEPASNCNDEASLMIAGVRPLRLTGEVGRLPRAAALKHPSWQRYGCAGYSQMQSIDFECFISELD
jgi:hypothetical protein